jgi:hypothetical protein
MKKELKAKLILQKFMENMPMVVEVVFSDQNTPPYHIEYWKCCQLQH